MFYPTAPKPGPRYTVADPDAGNRFKGAQTAAIEQLGELAEARARAGDEAAMLFETADDGRGSRLQEAISDHINNEKDERQSRDFGYRSSVRRYV